MTVALQDRGQPLRRSGPHPPPFHAEPRVSLRFLTSDERPYASARPSLPLVIEPRQGAAGSLARILRDSSADVFRALDQYGAVLCRGFEVWSSDAFAEAITNVDGFSPMDGYFMAEPGRQLVNGTRHVFHTNTLVRTGGNFARLGSGFHSENYFSADVPAYQTFWCETPSWLGGETALVHMPGVYDALPEETKARLESPPVCTPTMWSAASVARAYGLPEAFIVQFFRDLGFPVVEAKGATMILLQKPLVYLHPRTGARTLSGNLSSDLATLQPVLERLFAPHYSSWRWALHRAAWSRPRLSKLLRRLENLPLAIAHHPWHTLQSVRWQRRRAPEPWRIELQELQRRHIVRMGAKVTASDIEALGVGMWKQCSVIRWRRGDVLIWDNLQALHAGMPGLGPRTLRVMLCNPLPYCWPIQAGVAELAPSSDYATVDARLRRVRSA